MPRDLRLVLAAALTVLAVAACTPVDDEPSWRVEVGADQGIIAVEDHLLVRTQEHQLIVIDATTGDVRRVELSPPDGLEDARVEVVGRLGDAAYVEWAGDHEGRLTQVLSPEGDVRGSIHVEDARVPAQVHGSLLRWVPRGGARADAIMGSDGRTWTEPADPGFRGFEMRSGAELVPVTRAELGQVVTGANPAFVQVDDSTALVWARDASDTWLAVVRPGDGSGSVTLLPCPASTWQGPIASPDSSLWVAGQHLVDLSTGSVSCAPEDVVLLGDDGSVRAGDEHEVPVAVFEDVVVVRDGQDLVGTSKPDPTG